MICMIYLIYVRAGIKKSQQIIIITEIKKIIVQTIGGTKEIHFVKAFNGCLNYDLHDLFDLCEGGNKKIATNHYNHRNQKNHSSDNRNGLKAISYL
jgi:hypothetical protein